MTLLQRPLSDSSERIVLGLPPAFHLPVTVRAGFRAVAQNAHRVFQDDAFIVACQAVEVIQEVIADAAGVIPERVVGAEKVFSARHKNVEQVQGVLRGHRLVMQQEAGRGGSRSSRISRGGMKLPYQSMAQQTR